MKFKLSDTIEPVVFLLNLSNGLTLIGQVNLTMDKVCGRNLCNNGTCDNAKICLQQSTDLNTWKLMLKECLPIIPILFAGYWRDKHGRTVPLLWLSIIGQTVGTLTYLLSSIFWQEFPILPTVLIEAIICGLTGGIPLSVMACTCFIAANTSVQDRTVRMSLLLAIYFGGTIIGSILVGVILQKFGYVLLYSVAMILAVVALLYTFVFISEVAAPSKKTLPIWLIFKAVMKKRDNNHRPVIIMMIIVYCTFGTSLRCEGSILTFFLQKSLKFSVAEAGIFAGYKLIIVGLSTFIVVPVLSKYYKMKDVLLGILSATFTCFSSILTAMSRSKLELLLYPLPDLLRGGVLAVEKSIITKYVGPSEIGQVLSVEFFAEACGHLMLLPLYNFVYNKTSETFPGAFFFLTTLLSFITLVIFCIVKYLMREKNKQPKLDDGQTELSSHL